MRQKPSSHQTIEAPIPMMRRTGGSAGSPKGSVQSSTPFASIVRSAKCNSVPRRSRAPFDSKGRFAYQTSMNARDSSPADERPGRLSARSGAVAREPARQHLAELRGASLEHREVGGAGDEGGRPIAARVILRLPALAGAGPHERVLGAEHDQHRHADLPRTRAVDVDAGGCRADDPARVGAAQPQRRGEYARVGAEEEALAELAR